MKVRTYNSKILNKIFADISKSEEKQVSSTMIIAALIGDEMEKKGLSIDDVAKIFKVKPITICNWLSGTFDFKISMLCKIEEKLEIELFKITPYIKYQNIVIGDEALTPADNGHIIIGRKALSNYGINSPEFTKRILEKYVKMGYMPRMEDGSITCSSNLICNCCAKQTPTLIMLEYDVTKLEHDYSNYPDVGLCGECFNEYTKIIHNHVNN